MIVLPGLTGTDCGCTGTLFMGAAGADCAGCPGIGTVVFEGALLAGADFVPLSKTVDPRPALRVAMIERESDVTMNSMAAVSYTHLTLPTILRV